MRSTGWAAFEFEFESGVRLALYPHIALAEEAAPGCDPPPKDAYSGVTLAINLASGEQLDEVFRQAVEAGAAPIAEPRQRPWGGRSGYVADPEGNRWELAWAPSSS